MSDTITIPRAELEQALEALKPISLYKSHNGDDWPARQVAPVISTLRARLEQSGMEQVSVAWRNGYAQAKEEADMERRLSQPERQEQKADLWYELEGVIVDVEQGSGFDDVCLRTIKRVRDALIGSPPPRCELSEEEQKAEPAPLTAHCMWFCKVGTLGDLALPQGADWPMRVAVKEAFKKLTGVVAEFCFSGWGDKLEEQEMAVVKNRLTRPQRQELSEEEIQACIDEAAQLLRQHSRGIRGQMITIQDSLQYWVARVVERKVRAG